MLNKRIFVKKKDGFNIKEVGLLNEFKNSLKLEELTSLEYYVVYDVFFTTEEELKIACERVFCEKTTDIILNSLDLENKSYIAVETLPNQFDPRAKSAQECVYLLNPTSKCKIKTSEVLVFNNLENSKLKEIKDYYINAIECREKDLDVLEFTNETFETKEEVLEGFTSLDDKGLEEFLDKYSLALSFDNLKYCRDYFKKENRDPILGELKVIDTYWSDHCRHLTFHTILENIKIEDEDVNIMYKKYLSLREELDRQNKPITLMDIGTIFGRYAKEKGILTNLEDTKEDNAISLEFVEDGIEYLYQFKNETHNHPTEIEPYGGAATCIGGAIRDPLSGRAFVYQGLRISGAANILEETSKTLKGKLPQRVISQKSSDGFSSYGNQIGLATTYVKELYHPGYKAKHLEAGAVVGVAKKASVTRKEPVAGDVILLLGGKTGFDGIGGATGSSKSHDVSSLSTSSVEVQKGNALEEKKIQRLFTNDRAIKLIKKCNDFGAGGISVAIGELSESIEIYLDKVPLKVSHLKASDIALSESQERMAVVLDPSDVKEFENYAKEENLEITEVAKVVEDNRLKMYYNGEIIINIDRTFLDSSGVDVYQDVKIGKLKKPNFTKYSSLEDCFKDMTLVDNKNMETKFDSTVGATTVLMPYGGKYELTKEDVSVQKIPYTKTKTSHVAYGFNPYLTEANTYVGSQMAVVDSITRVVASGVKLADINLSFQEYFRRLGQNPENWGDVMSSLLGALKAQEELKTPALGGKDSMSGTYEDLNVPPTLISFAYGVGEINNVISSTIKNPNEYIYLLNDHIISEDDKMENFNYDKYKENIAKYEKLILENKITAARATSDMPVAAALSKMLMGNKLGCIVDSNLDLFERGYGTIIFTSPEKLDFYKLGQVTDNKEVNINSTKTNIEQLIDLNFTYFDEVFSPINGKVCTSEISKSSNKREYNPKKVDKVNVFIPLFPGTNSEREMQKAFEAEGCDVKIGIFKNITPNLLKQSIEEFEKLIKWSNIIAIPGGFSGADEPDGSGKYIVNVLCNPKIKQAIETHLEEDKLIIGICNGFQALIKSGLITNSTLGEVNEEDPTLFRNDCNYHISKSVTTKLMTVNSPWLSGLNIGDTYTQIISHGEGKLCVNNEQYLKLKEQDQIAFCYEGENPNGSDYNIEGMLSPCGKILGKMAHSERFEEGLYLNLEGSKKINLFANAVNYFKK